MLFYATALALIFEKYVRGKRLVANKSLHFKSFLWSGRTSDCLLNVSFCIWQEFSRAFFYLTSTADMTRISYLPKGTAPLPCAPNYLFLCDEKLFTSHLGGLHIMRA